MQLQNRDVNNGRTALVEGRAALGALGHFGVAIVAHGVTASHAQDRFAWADVVWLEADIAINRGERRRAARHSIGDIGRQRVGSWGSR